MRTIVRYFVVLPIALLVLAFSVANRHLVGVHIDPFAGLYDSAPLEMPLFVVVLTALLLGLILGGIFVWFAQGKHRKAARHAQREADRLRGEVERAHHAASPPVLRQN